MFLLPICQIHLDRLIDGLRYWNAGVFLDCTQPGHQSLIDPHGDLFFILGAGRFLRHRKEHIRVCTGLQQLFYPTRYGPGDLSLFVTVESLRNLLIPFGGGEGADSPPLSDARYLSRSADFGGSVGGHRPDEKRKTSAVEVQDHRRGEN